MRRFVYHIILIAGLIPGLAHGQTNVEVITKTIVDQFSIASENSVKIQGNAAKISVRSWDQNEIKVTIKLISKGLTRDIAKKELGYHKYVIDQLNKQFIVRNYLLLPNELESLSTIQEATIDLMVPKEMDIEIENSLGMISLNSIKGEITIDNKYGDVELVNLRGSVEITNVFGSLTVNKFSGKLLANLEHTSSKVNAFSGTSIFNTNLGDIEWNTQGQVKQLKFELRKSNLKFSDLDFDSFYWKLRTKYGEIHTPVNQNSNKVIYGNNDLPAIEVYSDFGNIIIEE